MKIINANPVIQITDLLTIITDTRVVAAVNAIDQIPIKSE